MEEKSKEHKNSGNKIDLKTLSELKASKSRTMRSTKRKTNFSANRIFQFFQDQSQISQVVFDASASRSSFKKYRGKVLFFVHYNNAFRNFIKFLILFDTLILSLDNFPVSKSYSYALETIDFTIFLIYCLEAIWKIFGYGLKLYMKNPFNFMDMILILLNISQYSYQTYLVNPYNFEAMLLQNTLSGPFIKPAKAFRILEAMYHSKLVGSFAILFKAFLNSLVKMRFFMINSVILTLMAALIGKELFAYKVRYIEGGQWETPKDL